MPAGSVPVISASCFENEGLVPGSIPEEKQLEDGSGAFPLTLMPKDKKLTAKELRAIFSNRAKDIRALAMKHGAVLLRGFDVDGAEDFAEVSRSLNCEDYSYIGGAAPRTELVPNLVFTSNESPPEEPIPFHHELAQAPVPPKYILFCCEIEGKEGGATPIIHSAEVANFFTREYPEFAKEVAEKGVRYMRVMPEETDPQSALGRSWKETYKVTTRPEAEETMRAHGTSFEWLPNGDCKTVTDTLPGLRFDERTGKQTFFNSIVAAYTGWYDARNDGKKAVLLGDGTPVDAEAINGVLKFMMERRVAFKWLKGDVLIIDNSLAMHSRDTFVPPRRVLASIRGPPLPESGALNDPLVSKL